jgi:hypothetical protein
MEGIGNYRPMHTLACQCIIRAEFVKICTIRKYAMYILHRSRLQDSGRLKRQQVAKTQKVLGFNHEAFGSLGQK